MMASYSLGHVVDLLPDYLVQALADDEMAGVAAHLVACADCRAELRSWEGMQSAMLESSLALPSPSPQVLQRALATIDVPASAVMIPVRSRRQYAQVMLRQVRLLNPIIWPVTALGIILAAVFAMTQPGKGTLIFNVVLPLISAVGTAFISGPENDPGLELLLATPISPRLVLISRWGWLLGYNLAIALVATFVLAAFQHGNYWSLVLLWVGPVALLSAFSVLVSAIATPVVAGAVAAALWLARFADPNVGMDWQRAQDGIWQTSPFVLCLTLICLALAVFSIGRREPHFGDG
jgi:hypothetical protein